MFQNGIIIANNVNFYYCLCIQAKQEIIDKRIEGSLLFVLLKKLNRLDKVRIRAGRDTLHKEKLRVDSNRLQLQNLLYEADHLKKEVQRCYQFKSQDEEIDLVSIDEFYKNAPESVSKPVNIHNKYKNYLIFKN